MGNSSQVVWRSVEESTWGTTPASAGVTGAHVLSQSGGLVTPYNSSGAIRPDMNTGNTRRASSSGAQGFNYELTYGDLLLEQWIEGIFRSDWSAAQTITATDISFTAPNTIATAAGDFSIFSPYTWVRVAGSASNNSEFFVTSTSTSSMTTASWSTVTTEIAGASMTIDNDGHLATGTTMHYYSLERDDASNTSTRYWMNPGLVPNNLTMDISSGASFITGTIGFDGKPPNAAASSTAYTGGPTAATSNTQFNPGSGLTAIFENSAAVATCTVNSIQLSLSSPNRLQYRLGAGSLEPCAIDGGTRVWTITMDVVADDNGMAIFERRRADTLTSCSFRLVDPSGNILRARIPQIRLTDGNPEVGGNDETFGIALQGQMEVNSAETYLMAWDRFAA